MPRTLQPHHLAIEPNRTFETYPEDNLDGWGDVEDARNPYFKKGDVVAAETDHGPRKALIVYCGREYSSRSGDWIPRYKVRLYKADGTLGRAWRWTYPGFIARALDALAAQKEAEA